MNVVEEDRSGNRPVSAPLAAAMASREQARVGQEYVERPATGLFVDKELQEVCHPNLQLIIGRTE